MEKNNKNLNVPNLRFPEFAGEWEIHKLSEYLDFKNGLNPDAKRFGRGLPFISVMDILADRVICYDNIRAKVEATDKEIECFGVNKGDLLFQRSSETFEDVGRANVYMDNRTAIYGGFVIRGRKIGNYDPLFFKYLLATPLARKRTCRMGAGAQHFNIGQEGLSKISLHFPSIEEQSKIANLFSLIDERVETQKKIIEDLKKLKDAITHFHHKNELSHSPMVYIGQYITQVPKRNKDAKIDRVLSISNKYGFINQNEQFEDREVASADTSNYKVVHKGDFAYNPARINVGSVARLQEFENGIVSPMYVCFTAKKGLLPAYFELYLSTSIFKHEMNKRLEGSVRLCLTYESLCNIKIALPEFNVQKDFVSKVSAILTKIRAEERLLYLYHNCKQYLLSQMFI